MNRSVNSVEVRLLVISVAATRAPGFIAGVLFVCASALAGCANMPASGEAHANAISRDRSALDQLVLQFDSLRSAARIPGLAIVVLRDTTVLLARGLGFADLDAKVPVTADTPFNIASVTKPISAVVALRLVERGLLDLDRPMTSYDGYAEYCKAVREDGGLFFGTYDCEHSVLTMRNLLSMTMNGQPGTRFFYNPPGYSWASRPMAQVSGMGFSELMAKEIFGPAGMRDSRRIHRRLPLAADMMARLAKPYHADSTGRLVLSDPPPPQGDGAAGGVISTAMDLARFDIALTQGRLLNAASRKAMWTAGRSPSGEVLPYGLGWFVQQFGRESLSWHAGLWDGAYSALYLKCPSRGLTLILLANSEGLRWEHRLDEAAVQRSPFVQSFLTQLTR